MNKKFVYGWWLPKENNHFEGYLSKSIEVGDKEFINFLINPSLFSSHTKIAQKKVEKYTKENMALKCLDLINYENI